MTHTHDGAGRGPGTVSVHGVHAEPRRAGDPVVPPIVQSSTFYWGHPDDGALIYSRLGNNPNQRRVAEKVAALEGAEAAAVAGSGMGATAMTFLALVAPGDHIVASTYLYGATHKLLRDELPRRGVDVTFVDPYDVDALTAAITPRTRVLHLELPVNPTLRVFDPEPLVRAAHAGGVRVTCDATFASPLNFRPMDVGIDVVIHSATKYLGGHSDLIAGAVAGPAEVIAGVEEMMKLYGPALDPHAAWLLDRGLRTLEVRVERQNAHALELARWFEGRKGVAGVLYPGLPSHPDHGTAARLLKGFGGVLSVILEGGGAAADRFVGALELASAAPSLGGVETLVSQPRYTSHVALDPAAREVAGIPDGFVRISVGLENLDDLKADFAQALAAAA